MFDRLCRAWLGSGHAVGAMVRLATGRRAERGMSTAEYAVGIMAACTFALVLLGVVRSDAVRTALTGIVQNALGLAG